MKKFAYFAGSVSGIFLGVSGGFIISTRIVVKLKGG